MSADSVAQARPWAFRRAKWRLWDCIGYDAALPDAILPCGISWPWAGDVRQPKEGPILWGLLALMGYSMMEDS